MIGWVQAQAWKLGTFGAAAVALLLGVLLLVEKAETGRLTAANAALSDAIYNPQTGYIAQLSQCHTNVESLKASLDSQSTKVKALEADSNRRLAAAEEDLAEARATAARLEVRADATLDYRPAGADACARVEDVRRKYLEALK